MSTSVGTSSPRLLATSSVTITCTVASGAKTITWWVEQTVSGESYMFAWLSHFKYNQLSEN